MRDVAKVEIVPYFLRISRISELELKTHLPIIWIWVSLPNFLEENRLTLEAARTPYEEYLRQSISNERARLDSLYNEFAKSNPVKKEIVRRRIEEAIQNIDLLQKDLDKYRSGLSWLREPSKERDEKAEHLPKLEKEAAPPAATAPKPVAAGPQAKPVVARPTIGKPVGSTPAPSAAPPPVPRPTVGTPATARPKIGTPVGTPSPQAPNSPPPSQSQQAAPRPVVGTPVKRPVIGTPIGKPKLAQDQQEESKDTSSSASA